MLAVDTCSWFKIKLIEKELGEDLIAFFKKSGLNLFFTYPLHEELAHFFPGLKTFIKNYPLLPQGAKFKEFLSLGFDEADSSLLEYAAIQDAIVVSEDPEMRTFAKIRKFKVIPLAQLVFLFFKWKKISPERSNRIINFLREKKNIGKREHEKLIKKF